MAIRGHEGCSSRLSPPVLALWVVSYSEIVNTASGSSLVHTYLATRLSSDCVSMLTLSRFPWGLCSASTIHTFVIATTAVAVWASYIGTRSRLGDTLLLLKQYAWVRINSDV